MSSTSPKMTPQRVSKIYIKNRVYRQCARDGFSARLKAEVAAQQAGEVPNEPPLHSYHQTRQSFFNKGWHAVTYMDIARVKAKFAANQANQQKHQQHQEQQSRRSQA